MADKPVPAPDPEALIKALQLISDYQLHYYQLLYFHSPRLTNPDASFKYTDPARPFSVRRSLTNEWCLEFYFTANPDYTFLIGPYLKDSNGKPQTQEERDADIIHQCEAILKADAEGKQKIDNRACCPLAVYRGCVCVVSFSCVLHGQKCIGSHD